MSIWDEEIEATGEQLASIGELVSQAEDLEQRIEEVEARLKDLQNSYNQIMTRDLPSAFNEAGVQDFTTINGKKVTIDDIVRCSIPKERKDEAFEWLRENGAADLIKQDITVSFTKGEDEKAREAVRALTEAGFVPSEIPNAHWQTLSSWAKEQLSKGVPLPEELLGLYVGQKAKIKEKK